MFKDLVYNNVIIYGDFTLKSGVKSDYYVNIKKTISIPHLFNKIIDMLITNVKRIPNYKTDYAIIGVPYSGIPFASVVASRLEIPLLLMRLEQKKYGTKQLVEGESGGRNVILIEDVVTTGKSINETVAQLVECDLTAEYVFTIFQRGIPKFDTEIKYNYLETHPMCLSDKLDTLKHDMLCRKINDEFKNIFQVLNSLVKERKSNLIVSLDFETAEEVKGFVRDYVDYFIGIKLHFDFYQSSEIADLSHFFMNIKRKTGKDFIVIDDRKYADICATNEKQFEVPDMELCADICICHGVAGFEFAKKCLLPVLVVAQMSNKGNLINDEYTEACVTAGFQHDNIIGFISQENLGYHGGLYFKPGVNLRKVGEGDGKDQQYTGKTDGIDFYIVGRAITQSDDIKSELMFYNKELFN